MAPQLTMKWPVLALLVLVQLWIAHAVVFFAHEYAHAIVAWALGWKRSPFDLDYSQPSMKTVLIQLGINQKVDEARIYGAGRPLDVGLIAIAGMVLGNAFLTYPLGRLGYRWAVANGHPGWALLAFWFTVASVGNFIDYVPIRTFTGTQSGDMASTEHAFGWSPWLVMILLGTPTLLATIHLLWRVIPTTVERLFPSLATRCIVAVLSVPFWVLRCGGAARRRFHRAQTFPHVCMGSRPSGGVSGDFYNRARQAWARHLKTVRRERLGDVVQIGRRRMG